MRRILLVLVVLLALVLGAVWWRIDAIAETAIERAGSSALGVPTSVGVVLLRPFAGALSILGLEVANPPGYEGAFLEVGSARLDVELGTLLEPTVVAPQLAISDVDLVLERRLRGSNYDVILANTRRSGGGARPPAEPSAEGGKQFVVRDLVIRDVTARIRLVGLPGVRAAGREVTVQIPEVRLQDVGSRTKGGVVASQLLGTVVVAVVQAVAREVPQLPGNVAGELRAGLGRLGGLPLAVSGEVATSAEDLAAGALKDLGDAVTDPGKVVEEPGKAVDDTTEALKERGRETLRGLLGGEEEPEGGESR